MCLRIVNVLLGSLFVYMYMHMQGLFYRTCVEVRGQFFFHLVGWRTELILPGLAASAQHLTRLVPWFLSVTLEAGPGFSSGTFPVRQHTIQYVPKFS